MGGEPGAGGLDAGGGNVDLGQAIVLGIVQGLTEWLPISSTAHLRIVPELAGWPDPGAAFTASIQLGTLLAVLIYFGRDLARTAAGWARGWTRPELRKTEEYRLGWGIALGTIPIVALGLLLKSRIESEWRSLYVVAFALIGMGAILLLAERAVRTSRGLGNVRAMDGLWVGLWQALALVPGASRSGSTISGALLAGFDRTSAARLSFLLSVPSVLAAGVFSLWEHRAQLLGELLVPMLVANVFSFVAGYSTIAFLMGYLQRRGVLLFVAYRFVLGIAILAAIQGGILRSEPQPAAASGGTRVSP